MIRSLLILVFLILSKCISFAGNQNNDSLITSFNRISLEVFLNYSEDNKNYIIPAFPVAYNLATSYLGAIGSTQENIGRLFNGKGKDVLFESQYRRVSKIAFGTKRTYLFNHKNLVLYQKGFQMEVPFSKTITSSGLTSFSKIDFSDTNGTKQQLSSFIRSTANNRDRFLTLPLKSNNLLDFISVSYFYSNWEGEFDRSLTKTQPFYLDEKKAVNVDYMNRSGGFGYYENDNMKAVEIFFKGKTASVILIFPKKGGNIEKELDIHRYNSWNKELGDQQMEISIPKFSVHSQINLKSWLKDSLYHTFSNCDFGRIKNSTIPICIGDIQTSAWLELDEKGAEFTGASSIGYTTAEDKPMAASKNSKTQYPFIFIIRDRLSGLILFVGKIKNPSQ